MTIEYSSMNTYEKWAQFCINKFVYSHKERHRLLQDTDFVGGMMTALMKADQTYDPAKGMTPKSHRIQYGKYYILKNYAKQKREHNNWEGISLYHSFIDKEFTNLENKEYIKSLFDKASLSEIQRKCVELYYLDGKTNEEIGKILGFSKQAANNNVRSGLEKIRNVASR